MATSSFEHTSETRAALRAIVSDPAYGTRALSSAQTMARLLRDLLPDAPRERSLLVAAADVGVAATLASHVRQGWGVPTAIRLAASSFAATVPITPADALWVTEELAIALGLLEEGSGQASGAATAQAGLSDTPTQLRAAEPPPVPPAGQQPAAGPQPSAGQEPVAAAEPATRPRPAAQPTAPPTPAPRARPAPQAQPAAQQPVPDERTEQQFGPTPAQAPAAASSWAAGRAGAAFAGAPGEPYAPGQPGGRQPAPPGGAATGGGGRRRPAGRRPSGRRLSRADQPDDPVARAVKAAVRPGLLAFNPPTEMIQGRKERVEVGIARSPELRDALAAGLRGHGQVQFEPVATSPFMGVELKGSSFEIIPFSPVEQLVTPTARWEFDVRPYRAGQQTLALCVSLRVDAAGPGLPTGGRIAIPVLERHIRIRVDVGYGARRFLASNWQWLIGTAVAVGAALAAWAALIH